MAAYDILLKNRCKDFAGDEENQDKDTIESQVKTSEEKTSSSARKRRTTKSIQRNSSYDKNSSRSPAKESTARGS